MSLAFFIVLGSCRQNRDFSQKREGYCIKNRNVLDVHVDLRGNYNKVSDEKGRLTTAPREEYFMKFSRDDVYLKMHLV